MVLSQMCSCGGKVKAATLKSIDLAPIFGLLGILEGPVPGLRCDACHAETFDGSVFSRMLVAVARSVLGQTRILTAQEARFLRKAVIELTQVRLAEQMGINPTTVADWERNERPISKEHDYELRGIAFATLLTRAGASLLAPMDVLMHELFARPRTLAAPRRAHRYVVRAPDMSAA